MKEASCAKWPSTSRAPPSRKLLPLSSKGLKVTVADHRRCFPPVENMSFPDRRTANVLLTILLFAVVTTIVYVARTVIVIFCFGLLFAYLIDPVVRFLQRHSLFFKSLGTSCSEAYVVLLVGVALGVHMLAPGLPGRALGLVQHLPELSARLATGEVATDMASQYGWSNTEALHVKTFLVNHSSNIQNLTVTIKESAKTVIGAAILIPILAIFFLSAGESMANGVIALVASDENRDAVHSLAADLHSMMQHYIRAKVILGDCRLLMSPPRF